jgi:hypothetical protein
MTSELFLLYILLLVLGLVGSLGASSAPADDEPFFATGGTVESNLDECNT